MNLENNKHLEDFMEYFGILGGIGAPELLIILMIILVLFGSKLLPKLSRSVGQTASELRKGLGDNKRQAQAVTVKEDGHESAAPVSSIRAPRV